jgi:hypothetical protein
MPTEGSMVLTTMLQDIYMLRIASVHLISAAFPIGVPLAASDYLLVSFFYLLYQNFPEIQRCTVKNIS